MPQRRQPRHSCCACVANSSPRRNRRRDVTEGVPPPNPRLADDQLGLGVDEVAQIERGEPGRTPPGRPDDAGTPPGRPGGAGGGAGAAQALAPRKPGHIIRASGKAVAVRHHRRGRSDTSSTSLLLPAFQGCGCGEVRPLPGLLQSRGQCSHAMAPDTESARDFTRVFSGCTSGKGDLLLLVVTSAAEPSSQPEPPTRIVCSSPAAHGDVTAPVMDAAISEFRASVLRPALVAAGGSGLAAVAQSAEALASLCARVVGSCTVGAAMDLLLDHSCMPQLFQNKYVILVSGDEDAAVRVLTYGFVGDAIGGDRPDTKHTPYVLRMLTENLLHRHDDGGDGSGEADSEQEAVAASLQSVKRNSSLQLQYSVCNAAVESAAKIDAASIESVIKDDGSSGRMLAACRQPGGNGDGSPAAAAAAGSDTSAHLSLGGSGGGASALLDGPRCRKCGECSNTPRPEPAASSKTTRKQELFRKRRGMHRRSSSF